MSPGGGTRRGDLAIEPEGGLFVLRRDDDPEAGVVLTAEELRWLVLAAGSAMLARHAPRPTPAEAAARRGDLPS